MLDLVLTIPRNAESRKAVSSVVSTLATVLDKHCALKWPLRLQVTGNFSPPVCSLSHTEYTCLFIFVALPCCFGWNLLPYIFHHPALAVAPSPLFVDGCFSWCFPASGQLAAVAFQKFSNFYDKSVVQHLFLQLFVCTRFD